MVKTDLCVIAHSRRQQGEGVFNCDPPLYNVLTQTLEAVLTVRSGQVQQAWQSKDSNPVSINNYHIIYILIRIRLCGPDQ